MNEKLDKLIKFMERKTHIIGYPKYFTPKTKKIIKEFEENSINYIYNNILSSISVLTMKNVWDHHLCPFCLNADNTCFNCFYRIINGECGEENSTYRNIIKKHFSKKENGLLSILKIMNSHYSLPALKNLFLYEIFHERGEI